jgi:hypothetical protein
MMASSHRTCAGWAQSTRGVSLRARAGRGLGSDEAGARGRELEAGRPAAGARPAPPPPPGPLHHPPHLGLAHGAALGVAAKAGGGRQQAAAPRRQRLRGHVAVGRRHVHDLVRQPALLGQARHLRQLSLLLRGGGLGADQHHLGLGPGGQRVAPQRLLKEAVGGGAAAVDGLRGRRARRVRCGGGGGAWRRAARAAGAPQLRGLRRRCRAAASQRLLPRRAPTWKLSLLSSMMATISSSTDLPCTSCGGGRVDGRVGGRVGGWMARGGRQPSRGGSRGGGGLQAAAGALLARAAAERWRTWCLM